jgi:hypothetical protein
MYNMIHMAGVAVIYGPESYWPSIHLVTPVQYPMKAKG